jgi:hypothetical protein
MMISDQMKEELAAGLGERQVSEFVEDNKVHAGEIFGEAALAASAGFTLQPVDQAGDGVEAATGGAADAGPGDGYGEMRLAGAGRSRDMLPDTRGRTRRFTTPFIRSVAAGSRLSGVIRSGASQCWSLNSPTGR